MTQDQTTPLTEAERTALYRFFDADEQLLYVGITGDPRTRWAQHAAEKPWWSNVVRHTVEWLPCREAAEAAEVAAITTEGPLHNVWGTERHRAASTAFHGERQAAEMHPAVKAVRAALRAVERIEDAEERALVATALLREWPRLHAEVREVRQDAVIAMNEAGSDFGAIGRRLGVGGQRAAHIAQGK